MTATAERMLRLMDRATVHWHFPVIGRRKGRLIRRLLARHRPTSAIEIGSLFGYSAILIAGHLPPGGRLTCVEANGYLARFVQWNVTEAGFGRRVSVIEGDALRVIPRLRARFDFVLIDAAKEQYLGYLEALEPKLRPGAVIVADNTKLFRRAVRPYLAHVRRDPRYLSREYDFGDDAMEVSVHFGGGLRPPENALAAKPRRSIVHLGRDALGLRPRGRPALIGGERIGPTHGPRPWVPAPRN